LRWKTSICGVNHWFPTLTKQVPTKRATGLASGLFAEYSSEAFWQ